MNDVERLLALEEIKVVKARYCRCLDARDWDGWRTCFTDDVAFYLTRTPLAGIDALLAFGTSYLAGATSVHQVHSPEIEFTSDSEATGVWALHDVLIWPGPNMHGVTSLVGFGSYHERYRRIDHVWRICEVKVSRFHLETT